jgi:hypothetical protein
LQYRTSQKFVHTKKKTDVSVTIMPKKDAGSKQGEEKKEGTAAQAPTATARPIASGAGSMDLPIDLPLHTKLQQGLELYGPLAVVM